MARKQIVYGDVLLLNKTDLVSGERSRAWKHALLDIKPDARILPCRRRRRSPWATAERGLFDSDRWLQPEHSQPGHGHHHDHSHDHGSGGHHHHHNHALEGEDGAIEGFTSLSFRSDQPLDLRLLSELPRQPAPRTVFRAKGILWFRESERRHLFHLAGKRFSIDDDDWPAAMPRANRLVLIGRDLDQATLRQQLEACRTHTRAGASALKPPPETPWCSGVLF